MMFNGLYHTIEVPESFGDQFKITETSYLPLIEELSTVPVRDGLGTIVSAFDFVT